MKSYYDQIWQKKLSLPQYSTLEARWRSRWEFAYNNIDRRSKVLDGGCGDGVLGQKLIQENECEVYGLDISEYALEIAMSRGIKTNLCDISSEKFPFESDSFDAITFLCCLEHIHNAIHPLMEASRVVKVGGKILVTLPNATNISNRITFLFGKMPKEFLHINPGEGMHMQFFNYSNEFEDRVLSQIPNVRVSKKIPDFKNPKKYKGLAKELRKIAIKLFPNAFAEYTHWVLVKER